jgi:DNA-binding MarR family transcriptional regulator
MAGLDKLIRSAYYIGMTEPWRTNRTASDAALLRRAVSGLQRRLRAQDEPGGAGPTGLGILGRLTRMGVASAAEIAQREGLQPQSRTRALQALQGAGLIDRWTDEDDRRRTSIAITPKGEAYLNATMRKRVAWLGGTIEAHLNPAERDTLRAAALLMERLTGGGSSGRAAAKATDVVVNLAPSCHVADVQRSVDFYTLLGFVEDGRWMDGDTLVWASMHGSRVRAARIMFSLAEETVEPMAQGIHFYCWSDDITALRARLLAEGLHPGPIAAQEHMPNGEFPITDPDGYALLIGQLRPA